MRCYLLVAFLLCSSVGCSRAGASRTATLEGARASVTEAVDSAALSPRGEQFENPLYLAWSRFKIGTTVVHKAVTTAGDSLRATTTIMTHTLIACTDNQVITELHTRTQRYDGVVIDNP